MAEQQLERSMLDGKDREQLHAIAGAMGIKGVTRLRKADLVDAILGAASGNGESHADGAPNGKAPKAAKATKTTKSTKPVAEAPADDDPASAPRRAVRSKRASELATDNGLADIAAEENSLGGGDDTEIAPRPMRRNAPSATNEFRIEDFSFVVRWPVDPRTPRGICLERVRDRRARTSGAPTVDQDDERASFGEGNRTGRRRSGAGRRSPGWR